MTWVKYCVNRYFLSALYMLTNSDFPFSSSEPNNSNRRSDAGGSRFFNCSEINRFFDSCCIDFECVRQYSAHHHDRRSLF
jgi:hypothetical protein